MKVMFSNPEVNEIFNSTYDYADVNALMYETGLGKQKVAKEEADAKIREIMSTVLGLEENFTKKDFRKAMRRHKIDAYEVMEEAIETLLNTGWGANPFFNEFVEMRNLADGDTNEFYVEDETILAVGEFAGNHHDIVRQKLGKGTTYSVKMNWYVVKVYTDFELFMTGRIDWAKFIQKIYEAYDKKFNDMIYAALLGAGAKLPNPPQFNKTGTLVLANVLTLMEDVQAATGDEVVIMGTKSALNKLEALSPVNWISDNMKETRNTLGRLAIWEGARLVEIPQVFEDNTLTNKLIANNLLLFMPVSETPFIKFVNEGDGHIKEITDGDTNMDMTIEYEYARKAGIAVLINKVFGMWTI